MAKQTVYTYKGKEYTSEYRLRNAIWELGRTVFGAIPVKDNKEEYEDFWNKLGVTVSEKDVENKPVVPKDIEQKNLERQRISSEITQYKRLLSESDYVVIKLNEFKAMYPNQTKQYEELYKSYASTLQQRTQWRARVSELEMELQAVG